MSKKILKNSMKNNMQKNIKALGGVTVEKEAVAKISLIGSALEDLIFNKSSEIKIKNTEETLKAIDAAIEKIGTDKISKEWFESVEGLNLLNELLQKTQFEASKEKIAALSKAFVASGSLALVNDTHKLQVLQKISEMSDVARKLLLALANINIISKKFKLGEMEQVMAAIWFADIGSFLEKNHSGEEKFWNGVLRLDHELNILESLGLIRRVQPIIHQEFGYMFNGLGVEVARFLA